VVTAVEAGASGLSSEALSALRQTRGKTARLAEIQERQKNLRTAAGGDPMSSSTKFKNLTKDQKTNIIEDMNRLNEERKTLLGEIKGLPGVSDNLYAKIQSQADSGNLDVLAKSMLGDDGVRAFSGTPIDPRVKGMVSSVVSRIIPDPKVSAEAAQAASGLGEALAGIPPAYLAAAAGVTGVAGGAVLTMPSAPAQPGY
jgi:hypothetical protein